MQNTPLFGISQITTKPWPLELDIITYYSLGLGIELWEFKFDKANIDDQIKLVKDSQIMITSVKTEISSIFPDFESPEPKEPSERLAKMKESIRKFAPISLNRPFIMATGALPSGNEAEVWNVCIKSYQELSKFAADHGVKIALEPLSPSLMNRSTIIYQLRQAFDMAVEVDHPNFGICIDLYNIWNDSLIENQIEACDDLIFLVQVADWKRPRSFFDRHIPGQGEIPLGSLIRSIQNTGYNGPYVLEIFSENVPNSLWDKDLTRVIQESREGFLKAWDWAESN